MSQPRTHISRALFSRKIPLLLLCLLVAFAAACQPKKVQTTKIESRLIQDLEEIVYEPYIPLDDEQPLTAAELKAFRSTGQLDANLTQEDKEIVELHFKFFVHEHRRTMERYIERSERFIPYAKSVFKERGIPVEAAYLFMVESGGNPNAVSPAGAAGLWQFMPYTGKKFGLAQTNWLDERRDPFKATHAAADYLMRLYVYFCDWHLALAAYNAGEGKIGRAIEGTGATNFFELCRLDVSLEEKLRLKQETRQYVPRLLAIVKIMRNLTALGFREVEPGNAWEFEILDIPPGTNLAGLSRAMDLTWEEFASMNPAFKRTASPPNDLSRAYILPEKRELAEKWLSSPEARTYADWKEYKIKKKDTLSGIASRHKTTVAALKEANSISKLPKPGVIILIPGKGAVEPVYDALPKESSSASASAGKYTIKPGDTLFSLAQTWGTDVNSIRVANRMGAKETNLKPGQRISIPGNSKKVPQPKAQSSSPPRSSYIVKPGDTLYAIAKSCNVTVKELCAANNFADSNVRIKAGQSLKIPAKGGAAASSAKPQAQKPTAAQKPKTTQKPQAGKASKTVTIAKGDTLFSLAKKHGTTVEAIQKANKMGSSNKLKLGTKIIIP